MREEIDRLREEAREAMLFLAAMVEQQRQSKHPEMFNNAIKQTRRKVNGLYRKLLNQRRVDNTTVV